MELDGDPPLPQTDVEAAITDAPEMTSEEWQKVAKEQATLDDDQPELLDVDRDMPDVELPPSGGHWCGLPTGSTLRQIDTWVMKTHVGMGHASRGEMEQALRDAGAVQELVMATRRLDCPICDSLKPPATARVTALPMKTRSFNECVVLQVDFVEIKLRRGITMVSATFLSVIDTWSRYAQLFHLTDHTAATAIETLGKDWCKPFGKPKFYLVDPELAFRSEEFTAWLQRTGQMMMSTAAEAPHQHGAVESFHRVFRRALLAAWKHADPGASPGEMADYIVAQRNDTVRVAGVCPSILALGHIPRRHLHCGGEDGQLEPVVASLLENDFKFKLMMKRRIVASPPHPV